MLCRRIKLSPAWRETGGKSALLLKGITSDKHSVSAREGCLCASELSAATQAKRFREQQRLGLASQEEFLLDAAALTKRKAETSGVAAWAEGDASDDEFEIDAPNQAEISYLSCTLLDMHPGRLSYAGIWCEHTLSIAANLLCAMPALDGSSKPEMTGLLYVWKQPMLDCMCILHGVPPFHLQRFFMRCWPHV